MLTQKVFPVPGLDKTVTAVVFYTDESIRSADGDVSMGLGLAEGRGDPEILFRSVDSVTAEFTYGWNTGVVTLTKHLDEEWGVTLECDTTLKKF